MNKEQIDQLALEIYRGTDWEERLTVEQAVISLTTRFLARVDAERAKEGPVAWLVRSRGVFNTQADAICNWRYHGQRKDEVPEPLFLHPQPIPEGYKVVPIEPTKKMMQAALATDVDDVFGVATYKAMLAAVPEVKP